MYLSPLRLHIRLITTASVLLIGLAVLIIKISPFPNDDTYIYFNYARNFVAGHPFAYDPRGILSEGFTSLIYLLLLVPFKALGVDLMFAALTLNILALFLASGLAALTLWQTTHNLHHALSMTVIFIALLILDQNVIETINHGLETILSPASMLAAAWAIAAACDPKHPQHHQYINWFYALAFLSFLIRPENLLLIGVNGGLVLLLYYPNRREVIIKALGLGLILGIYHGLKYLIFHDWVPTGFYRKVALGAAGAKYITLALEMYTPWLTVLGGLAMAMVVRTLLQKRPVRLFHPVAVFLTLIAISTLLFFLQVNPIVGYNFRFLFNAVFALFFGISILLVRLLRQSRWLYSSALVIFFLLFLSTNPRQSDIWKQMNLYQRTIQAVNTHLYVQLASYLRQQLPEYEQITLVFGDAGVIPYEFQSNFVDTNGLTEPYLAHLFRIPNSPEKSSQFADYVLSWKPDIIILGSEEPENGIIIPFNNHHSPFLGPQPLDVYARYRDYGIRYACTVTTYYDLHFGVWPDSPYYQAIVDALLPYCTVSGYTLPNGLTIELNGEQIHFPGILP